jgi:hypothetical protein
LSEDAFDSIEQVPIPLPTRTEAEAQPTLKQKILPDLKKARTAMGSLSAMDASCTGSVAKMSSSHSTSEMADPDKSSKEVITEMFLRKSPCLLPILFSSL